MIAQPTAALSTYASMRLPNSMAPWTPISLVAVSESAVHLGQVGQPRPEPVSRTAPPVTTMSTDITTADMAARWTVRGSGVQRAAMKASGLRRAALASARVTFGTRPIVGRRLCTLSRGSLMGLLPAEEPSGRGQPGHGPDRQDAQVGPGHPGPVLEHVPQSVGQRRDGQQAEYVLRA